MAQSSNAWIDIEQAAKEEGYKIDIVQGADAWLLCSPTEKEFKDAWDQLPQPKADVRIYLAEFCLLLLLMAKLLGPQNYAVWLKNRAKGIKAASSASQDAEVLERLFPDMRNAAVLYETLSARRVIRRFLFNTIRVAAGTTTGFRQTSFQWAAHIHSILANIVLGRPEALMLPELRSLKPSNRNNLRLTSSLAWQLSKEAGNASVANYAGYGGGDIEPKVQIALDRLRRLERAMTLQEKKYALTYYSHATLKELAAEGPSTPEERPLSGLKVDE
ncbi:Hypothetical predicted protein [Olea europaea subsp. europaea]|uniref:Uncharacterized protein n=1 Tax=Olea europaea subsp. europaea TaxID=158383 RepID=A0A8S0UNH2_OLEEU|nr:Hypothetical predicted protein [Olea europaea subsp. europaea]